MISENVIICYLQKHIDQLFKWYKADTKNVYFKHLSFI